MQLKLSGRFAQVTILSSAVLMFAGAALGQEHPDGFYLTSPLEISSGYDQNFISGTQTESDTVTILNAPKFAWLTSTHRTEFSTDYQPEFEFFAHQPGLDAWNHSSVIRLVHRINSRFTFEAGNSFLSTIDSSRAMENSLVLLPLGRFDQNALYADLVYHWNLSTKLTFRYDNAFTIVALPQVQGRLDNVSNAGTVTLDHSFDSHQQISASYSFLRVNPLVPQTAGSPSDVNLAILGYTLTVNPRLLVRLSAGAVEGPESGFNGSAAVEKKLGGVWIAAGYQRYIGFFGGPAIAGAPSDQVPFISGVTPSSIYHVVSLRASGNITKRLGIRLMAQHALNGTDQYGQGIKSTIAGLRLDYKLAGRLAMFAEADRYEQNINRFFDSSLSRSRYFAGFEIALSRPPEANPDRGKAPQDSIGVPAPDIPGIGPQGIDHPGIKEQD